VLNRRADGSEFPVELWTSVVHNDEGEPVALVGVARDITERKRTDENLRASLREKEVLLKEIHHRVKNNLQVISSLLSLQAEYLTDENMLRIMRDSQSRVKSMALVHEKLYQSHNLAEIDFGDYVHVLVMQLFRSYGVPQDSIQMIITADAVALSVDRAIPCGIIVNELITNALKYAFPGGRKGKIEVELQSTPPGMIRLAIRDDGVGLPENVEFHKADSLGLTLVRMLTDQVQGQLSIPRTTVGAEFVLTFRK
jgi:two-component sensor histidine kinase